MQRIAPTCNESLVFATGAPALAEPRISSWLDNYCAQVRRLASSVVGLAERARTDQPDLFSGPRDVNH